MSNNKDKQEEIVLETTETDDTPKTPEEASSSDPKLSPDTNSQENEAVIVSDDNINDSQINKETASSTKSSEIAQPTPNNVSETTSPKASCSYQDFGE